MDSNLLNQKALAVRIGVSRYTVWRWLKAKIIQEPAICEGKKKRWTIEQADNICCKMLQDVAQVDTGSLK